MSFFDKAKDSLKHTFIEEDENDNKPHQSPVAQATTVKMPTPPAVEWPVTSSPALTFSPMPTANTGSSEVYDDLVARTSFETSAVAKILQKYLAPMEKVSLDEKTKFQMAVLQAKAQEGLSPQAILTVFDELSASLKHENEAFNTKCENFIQSEITVRDEKIKSLTQQAAQLQQQITQISSELVGQQNKLNTIKSNFALAANRREIDINQQKTKYTALLQGFQG
jgi:hypothetical protein